MKRAFFGTLALALAILTGLGWWFRADLKVAWRDMSKPLLVLGRKPPQPDPVRYGVLKDEVERWRKELGGRYAKAKTTAERKAVLGEARVFLETALPDLMDCWLGTPWDFNGTSEKPGEGKIACGYFVSTVLRDAGFRLDRYKLARQPSQNILRTFLPKAEMSVRVGVPYESFAGEIRGLEPGIRIVGLDTHVGFLVGRSDGFRFVHSSGSKPWCVVNESETEAAVLSQSNYRVQGSLTANPEVIRKWLTGARWSVAGAR